ncbi:Acyl-CoA-binding domain-containing protein 5 [Mortierella sp. AD094]|nr:Acyl-CoA-binding domain-containing protein 5 [Mortierella sp. AD094]
MRPSTFPLERPNRSLFFSFTFFILLSALSNFVHSQAFTPSVTYGSSSVFIEGRGLYIQGGYSNTLNAVSQTFMIDLSTPWSTSNPVYRKLPDGIPEGKSASALSPDKQSWFVMSNSTAYSFNFNSSKWTNIFSSISLNPMLGLTGATDPSTGLVFIPNGQLTPAGDQAMLRVNLGTNTFDNVPMVTGLLSLSSFSTAWNSVKNSLFVFGGTVNGATSSTLYLYNTISQWSIPTTGGTAPPGRSAACLVPAYNDTRMVLFGGVSIQGAAMNDIYFLDVTTMTWTQGPDAAKTNTRSASSCAVTGDFFVSWGGSDGTLAVKSNTTLVYNMKTNSWTNSFGLLPTPSATTTTTATLTSTSAASTTTTPSSTTPATPPTTAPRWPIAVGVIIPVVLLVILLVFILYRRRKRDAKQAGAADNNSFATDSTEDPKGAGEGYDKEKQRFSHLRGPATESDPFGFFNRRLSSLRGPSTAGLGAKDDRKAFSQDGSRRFSHLRNPSATPEPKHQDDQSESARGPNSGGNQFANLQRFSHLRGPSTAGVAYPQDGQNDEDWAGYYDTSDYLDEEQSDYVPPPPAALPPRPHKSRYPMPPGHTRKAERELPSKPPVARHNTRRAPATFERESVFGYVDPSPCRGSPQKLNSETYL